MHLPLELAMQDALSTPTMIRRDALEVSTQAVAVLPVEGAALVVLAETPVHPVSATWPDQPADRGELIGPTGATKLLDAVEGGLDGEGILHVGDGLRGHARDPRVVRHVVHVVDLAQAPTIGDEVRVRVDADHRAALSRAHTAVHLTALALNRATTGMWHKHGPTDTLGSHDLDSAAVAVSEIHADRTRDEYRFGKSLRKQGFDGASLADRWDDVAADVEVQVNRWIASDASVVFEAEGPEAGRRSRWSCELDGRWASIPCGGTHVDRLGQIGNVHVGGAFAEGGQDLVIEVVVDPGTNRP